MTKATWVNIGGTWKKVKDVWVNIGGVWKPKVIPKGNIDGAWKEFMSYGFYIYRDGTELYPITIGLNTAGASGTLTKLSDSMRLQTRGSSSLAHTYGSTNSLIDVTEYTKLCVEWASTTNSLDSMSGLQLSTSRTVGYINSAVVARKFVNSSFSKRIDVLDISSFSGSYYIRVGASAPDAVWNYLDIYKIWLE